MKALAEVRWIEVLVCGKYKVKVPSWWEGMFASWPGWPEWETERFRSMEENLKQGDVLFDVGSETGWNSAIYAQFVGAENMCLFEPTPELWPALKATWEQNGLAMPRTACCAFVSYAYRASEAAINFRCWPREASEQAIVESIKFNHLNEDAHGRPQITLDCFTLSAVTPTAITIDVEGAEYQVLKGTEKTLREIRPLVWVSVHEKFMMERYGTTPAMIEALMESCGYRGTFLGDDHEAHWFYEPRSGTP
jgi:FkbM family methyltransferase